MTAVLSETMQTRRQWSAIFKSTKRRKKFANLPGAVAHAYNPSTLGGWGRQITWVRSWRPAWPMWLLKSTKISWVWWRVPVIPATWEAKAGESLELRRQRLQWAEITPLHSSQGSRVRLYLNQSSINQSILQLSYWALCCSLPLREAGCHAVRCSMEKPLCPEAECGLQAMTSENPRLSV